MNLGKTIYSISEQVKQNRKKLEYGSCLSPNTHDSYSSVVVDGLADLENKEQKAINNVKTRYTELRNKILENN